MQQSPENQKLVNRFTSLLSNTTTALLQNTTMPDFFYRDKPNGEYGYYLNPDVWEFYALIQSYGKNSVIDLGSGTGMFNLILHAIDDQLKLKGIEKEIAFYSIAKKTSSSVQFVHKDIMDLNQKDLEDYEVIYFWQPFYLLDKMKPFLDFLFSLISNKQLIVCKFTDIKTIEYVENHHKGKVQVTEVGKYHVIKKV